jgi:hypothetical protein
MTSDPHIDAVARGTERILLIEDEADVRDVTMAMLEKHGFTVVPACDGVSALEIWSTATMPFDLVLTDIVMPGMSGWDVFEAMRALVPSQAVLFMSGYSDVVLASHGVVESSIPLLQKPFTSAALARAVRLSIDAGVRI